MAVYEGSVFTLERSFGVIDGEEIPAACRERNCASQPSQQCTYIDSRGHLCGTWWCPRHLRHIGDGTYCRRHASTVAALGTKANDPRALPPVGHRGASLVNWVWTEGYELLNQAVTAGMTGDEILFEDHTVNVIRTTEGQRRWERGWRIGDRQGIICKVMICVSETDDATVHLKVNDVVVAQGVPPWITRRRLGQLVPLQVDAEDRRQFYSFLIGFVTSNMRDRQAETG